ncbi:MAG: type IV secretory system conjugative DNA transfer family protein [Ruminococcaceae bacterium]|nr:type IV secretory system conjugative DNA transfer family protein [Oscillospiraceae bacterium]
MKDNNYKYGRYINPNQETRWATTEEIQNAGTYIDLSLDHYPGAGLPVLSNGREAYVDNKDTHTLIFGATGSKKTRLFCMPMLNIFAKAGESFIATDPKGELYAKTSGMVKENGYDIVVLNYRDIGYGNMWNPLALPYELYHSGKQEEAIALLNDFVATISEPQFKNANDRFWPEMASSFALANLLLLMESGEPDEVNLASLAKLCDMENEDALEGLTGYMASDALASINYRGVLSAAGDTKRSIYASLFGMVRIFNTQKQLTMMLSGNTVDLRTIGKKKTAVYIIVPDEKTTYHFLVTTFIKQAYETLISEAQKTSERSLPIRVNFVLDEFCNIPKVPDMPSMISAARSRNMRFYLVAQSIHQLQGRYGEDADTIKGNCDNWVFLTSKELALLNEISELCGSIYTSDGRYRRLISISELQRFNKEKGEALIMHSRQYPIITEIADIDMYSMFLGFPSVEIKPFDPPQIRLFSAEALYEDVKKKKRKAPFGKPQSSEAAEEEPVDEVAKIQKELEQRFDELFGTLLDD